MKNNKCYPVKLKKGSVSGTVVTVRLENYEWSRDCQQAFDQLKQLLIMAPVMTLPDLENKLLETDAFGLDVGLNTETG